MKGPSEKRDQFAVLEYMKGGQMCTGAWSHTLVPPSQESSSGIFKW